MKALESARLPVALVVTLFVASGASALVYQLVWARMMMHVFGSTAVAVGTVLAAFMSGMAAGAWILGRIADRSTNCLRLYARLEFGIALSAATTHVLLLHFQTAYLTIHEMTGASATVLALARFLTAFLLVLGPTVLMGATLPVLTRLFEVLRPAGVGVSLSTLYASNTFGAVCGVLATGFFLIGSFGIHVPVAIALFGNLVIGLTAGIVARRLPDREGFSHRPTRVETPPAPAEGAMSVGRGTLGMILIGLGISGLTSFAYEVFWTRALVFVLGNSTFALTTMLSAFLTGIALGSYLIRFLLTRIRDRALLFGSIQVLLGLVSALALPLLFSLGDLRSLSQQILGAFAEPFALAFSGFGIAFLVMLVPAVLIGTLIPLVGAIAGQNGDRTGTWVGRVYAVNTLGNVVGALLPGAILLAWLGIQRGIVAMAIMNIAVGFTILFARLARPPRNPAFGLVLPALVPLVWITLSQAPLTFRFPSEGEFPFHRTLFYREGPLATTKVFEDPRTGEKQMSIDGIVIGGTGTTLYKQLLLAHLPKLLVQEVSSELSVGLGSGILVGESLRHARVRSMTAVDIEPGVVEGAALFSSENHRVLEDPRLTVVNDDIGNFLRTTADLYQVISADEKTADEYASNGYSYSMEYYGQLRRHLAPGGLIVQWVPTTLPPAQYRMILRTFAESLPHVQLWYFLPARTSGPFNSVLIGSNQRIRISHSHIEEELAESRDAYQSLLPYGLKSAESILAQYVADERVIRKAVSDARINSLEFPHYEFYYPWDYAAEKARKFVSNHDFIHNMKREAQPGFLEAIIEEGAISSRLREALAAEDSYLTAFRKFLAGIPLNEHYRLFDYTLSLAPWNDNLRSRTFTVYRHLASTQADPIARARLMRRADALLEAMQAN